MRLTKGKRGETDLKGRQEAMIISFAQSALEAERAGNYPTTYKMGG